MPKILLVDDNESNRDMLSRRLARRGYEVVLAVDGEDGVARATAESPDLILMDMNMPRVDGWEATRRLRAQEGTRLLPIIALTAHHSPGDREAIFEAGCDDHHAKPVDLAKLLDQIEAQLRRVRK